MSPARHRSLAFALAVAAAGCGPDEGDVPIDCDSALVPWLALAEEERVYDAYHVGDVDLFVVGPRDFDTSTPPRHRLVAVDGCGAEELTLLDDLADITAPPRAGLPWIAKLNDDASEPGTWIFDPLRRWTPTRIAAHRVSDIAWSERGVVVLRETAVDREYELAAVEVDAEGVSSQTMLAEHLRWASWIPTEVYRRVAVVTVDDELMIVDIATRTTAVVDEDVSAASVLDPSADTLFLIGDLPAQIRWTVRDVGSGVEIPVGRPEWSGMSANVSETLILAKKDTLLGPAPESDETQMILVPELRELWLPGDWSFGSVAASSFTDPLGEDVFDVCPLSGDRWAYVTDADESGLGELRLRSRVSGEDSHLASDVAIGLYGLNAGRPGGLFEQPGDAVFFEGPAGGERAIWRARPEG